MKGNNLSDKKFMILVVNYDPVKEAATEKILNTAKKQIGALSGEVRCVYQGSDEQIISALGKIMKLTEG